MKPRVLLSLIGGITAAGSLLVSGALAQIPDRPVVLLRSSILLPPVESTGTGLAPEVGVRVAVDERGKVTGVEVLSIRPASDLDEIFRSHVVQALSVWRYAPAIAQGEPVPASLEWTVQFKIRDQDSLGPTSQAVQDSLRRRQYLLGLPLEKQMEILRGYVEVAERFLDADRRRRFESPRFVVVTDAESPEAAEAVANTLEAALSAVEAVRRPRIEPYPHALKTVVYLYRSADAFEAMRQALLPLTHDKWTYYPPGLITYHLELPSAEVLQSFLIHESSHAYSDHHLVRPGQAMPLWFEEGFAEYLGNSVVKRGRLIPGKVVRGGYFRNHFADRVRVGFSQAGFDLGLLKGAIRRGEGLTLSHLLEADRVDFYGQNYPTYYGTSWLFVHFLRHGNPERGENSFSDLSLYIAEGTPGQEAIEAVYGVSVAELEEPFRKYVKSF